MGAGMLGNSKYDLKKTEQPRKKYYAPTLSLLGKVEDRTLGCWGGPGTDSSFCGALEKLTGYDVSHSCQN